MCCGRHGMAYFGCKLVIERKEENPIFEKHTHWRVVVRDISI